MREIKFKLWNVKKKKFYGPYSIYKINYGDSDPDEWIPIQFTGLHDRTGKEIYEGDIIEDRWGRKYIVEWSNERSGWIPFANGTGCGCCEVDMIYNSKDTEVIGNRYENPELLEEVGEIK